jgi:hypothetical protein
MSSRTLARSRGVIFGASFALVTCVRSVRLPARWASPGVQRTAAHQAPLGQCSPLRWLGELTPPPFHAIWTGRQRDEAPRIPRRGDRKPKPRELRSRVNLPKTYRRMTRVSPHCLTQRSMLGYVAAAGGLQDIPTTSDRETPMLRLTTYFPVLVAFSPACC